MNVPADYSKKQGIPAGWPGREEDMAQAVLLFGHSRYAYRQVSATLGCTRSPTNAFVDRRRRGQLST